MATSSTVTVRQLTEAEIPRHVYIVRHSFYAANDANNRIMYPQGVTPELLSYMVAKGVQNFKAAASNNIYLGAFASVAKSDGAGGEEEIMLATAHWILEDDKAAAAAAAKAADQPAATEVPPTANPEVYPKFHAMIDEGRARIMSALTSDPYWHLSLLATAPGYERRGAAGALLKWGLQRADAEARLIFLDSTELGRPVYQRIGFVQMEDHVFDGKPWGVDRVGHTYPMVRGVGGKPVEAATNGVAT